MNTQPELKKTITYDRETKDFEMRLDGELVGYARTYAEAEQTLADLVFSILTHPLSDAA